MNYLNLKRRATDSIYSGNDFDGFFKIIKSFKASVAYTAEQQLLRFNNAKKMLEKELFETIIRKPKSLIDSAKRYFKIREIERKIQDIFEKMISWMRATCKHFTKTSNVVIN